MGVTGLHKVLKSVSSNYERKLKIKDLSDSTVGIDTSFWLYQMCIAVRGQHGSDITNKSGEITTHLFPLLMRIQYLLKLRITPIFVFDGPPPEMKAKTLRKRKDLKRSATQKLEELEKPEDDDKIGDSNESDDSKESKTKK